MATWNRLVEERVGRPLAPETLGSVLIIVPGSSGDVALATTIVRWIKQRNPRCRVAFAVKRSNLPLLEMCPGVDEAVEIPTLHFRDVPGRRTYLAEFAGRADAVLYPVCVFEDLDLLRHWNFMEALWLLSGVPDGVPAERLKLWQEPPDAAATATRVLKRVLSTDFADELAARARRQPAEVARHIIRERTVKSAGWKNAGRLARHAAFLRTLTAQGTVAEAPARKYVIMSSDAQTVPAPEPGLFEALIQFLQSRGRIVLQNVIDPVHALPGTVPLLCSYPEFLSLRAVGVPFIGLRSGLCDIAAASPTPMGVLYPATMDKFTPELRANCETPLKTFGFGSMNVEANCLEIICNRVQDLDLKTLATILD